MDIGTDLPITDEVQISLDIDARRAEQGLDYFPFNGSMKPAESMRVTRHRAVVRPCMRM